MGILMLNGNNYTGGVQQVFGSSSGNIASFDDGGNNKPLKSLKVAINPVQSGSGDPSPSNVRPISGWTGANVARLGKNLFNKATVTSSKGLNASGTLINVNWCSVSDYIAVKPNTAYHMAHGVGNSSLCGGAYYTADKTFITYINSAGLKDADFSFTTSNNVEYIRLNVTTANLNTAQIELGTTATEYEPYAGTTYPITWSEAGKVFGGTLDVTNGKLKARPYYASYNGETLIGPWISSMDVYAPNTPPTTGAQVVDLGGVETEIDISPTQITSLLGNNNIWSDTGEIEECVYQRDLNIVINQFDARITALEQALNSSGTRSLSLSKSATAEEITEEPKEEEQNEDKR